MTVHFIRLRTASPPSAGHRRDPRDGNGNLTYDGIFTYGYDVESRLVSVKQGSTAVAGYSWDAQRRRKSKTVGATTTMFPTDADNREVLEYDGTSGAIERWYSFAPTAAMRPDAVLNEMDVAAGTRHYGGITVGITVTVHLIYPERDIASRVRPNRKGMVAPDAAGRRDPAKRGRNFSRVANRANPKP